MPFDSTDFNQPPRRPEPSHGRRRRRRLILFAAFWGGVLAGGPVAMLAWEAAHEPSIACDTPRVHPASAAPDAQRAAAQAHAGPCDTAPRATASR